MNEYHDELGRFCSKGEQDRAQQSFKLHIADLTTAGQISAALELSERYNQIWPDTKQATAFAQNAPGDPTVETETENFDAISFGGILDRAKNLFGGRNRKPRVADRTEEAYPLPWSDQDFDEEQALLEKGLLPVPEGRFVLEGDNGSQNEFQDYGTEFKNVRGFFRITGDPEQDKQAYERAATIDRAYGTQKAFQDAEAAVLFDGDTSFASEQEKKYFYNPELTAAIPNLTGWKPANETQAFVVKHMIDAAVDQKTAAFINADLIPDPAIQALGTPDDGGVDMKIAAGQDSLEDSGLISNYDEGWLAGYYTAVTAASQQQFIPGDLPAQKQQLAVFLQAQRDHWQAKADLIDNDFNNGAIDGFAEDNWSGEIN